MVVRFEDGPDKQHCALNEAVLAFLLLRLTPVEDLVRHKQAKTACTRQAIDSYTPMCSGTVEWRRVFRHGKPHPTDTGPLQKCSSKIWIGMSLPFSPLCVYKQVPEALRHMCLFVSFPHTPENKAAAI